MDKVSCTWETKHFLAGPRSVVSKLSAPSLRTAVRMTIQRMANVGNVGNVLSAFSYCHGAESPSPDVYGLGSLSTLHQ